MFKKIFGSPSSASPLTTKAMTIMEWNEIDTIYDQYKIRKNITEKIALVQGDITKLQVDAIVNAANKHLMGGGGVDGCIHRAAGHQALQKELRKIGSCEVGDAVVTSGAGIEHVKKIIHAVGPCLPYGKDPAGEEEEELKSTYIRSLELMVENNLRTIAFPCISTGIYGYPQDEAAWLVGNTLLKWIRKNAEKVDRIIICVFLEEDLNYYKEFFDAVAKKWGKKEAAAENNDEPSPKLARKSADSETTAEDDKTKDSKEKVDKKKKDEQENAVKEKEHEQENVDKEKEDDEKKEAVEKKKSDEENAEDPTEEKNCKKGEE